MKVPALFARFQPLLVASLFGVCLFPLPACADRGSIPFDPQVTIFEPTQRAMIAWNGKEEILLLSTDLRASKPTKVLEVIPLPNEPKVAKGDVEVFRKATALINKKLEAEFPKMPPSRGSGNWNAIEPAGEITFHQKIGAHNISVAHVRNPAGFVQWVNDYLRKSGVENPVIPPILKTSVEQYLQEKFTWFVFGVVELDEKPKTNEAIQYRFATDTFFYPLKISRTDSGSTSVDLLVLSPKMMDSLPSGVEARKIELRHKPVPITSAELKELNPEMDDLLGHADSLLLRIWRIRGNLPEMDKDIVMRSRD